MKSDKEDPTGRPAHLLPVRVSPDVAIPLKLPLAAALVLGRALLAATDMRQASRIALVSRRGAQMASYAGMASHC